MDEPRTAAGRALLDAVSPITEPQPGGSYLVTDIVRIEQRRAMTVHVVAIEREAAEDARAEEPEVTVDWTNTVIAGLEERLRECEAARAEVAEPRGFCGSCQTPGFFAGDGKHPCTPPRAEVAEPLDALREAARFGYYRGQADERYGRGDRGDAVGQAYLDERADEAAHRAALDTPDPERPQYPDHSELQTADLADDAARWGRVS